MPETQPVSQCPFKVLVEHHADASKLVDEAGRRHVTVIVSLYNYADEISEALATVAAQSLSAISLIVVDDASTDHSVQAATTWLAAHQDRFQRALVVGHEKNAGLAQARNTAFALAQTDYIFVLDADNALYPHCLARCCEALDASDAAFAYPILETFGAQRRLLGTDVWDRSRLARGNYIDAMALIRRRCWEEVGGYQDMLHGWEDYDLWCKFAEVGWWGVRVPEILARYRVHPSSMLRQRTNAPARLKATVAEIKRQHPWLTVEP